MKWNYKMKKIGKVAKSHASEHVATKGDNKEESHELGYKNMNLEIKSQQYHNLLPNGGTMVSQ